MNYEFFYWREQLSRHSQWSFEWFISFIIIIAFPIRGNRVVQIYFVERKTVTVDCQYRSVNQKMGNLSIKTNL